MTDPSGKPVAFSDDHVDKGAGLTTHQADSYLEATLPADGTYRIHLSDTQHKGGREHAYRLRVGAPRPDFELRVVPSSISARAGKVVPLTVHALRKDGFAGDIALSLKDAPESFKLGAAVVPSTQAVARVTLSVQPTVESIPTSIKLEGHAVIAGREVSHLALPAEEMMQAFEYRHLVPAEELKLATTGNMKLKAVSSKILSALPVKIVAGGTARVRIFAPAVALFSRARLELAHAPDGITIKAVAPSRDGGEIVFESDAAKVRPGQKGSLQLVAADGKAPPLGEANAPASQHPPPMLPAIPFVITAK